MCNELRFQVEMRPTENYNLPARASTNIRLSAFSFLISYSSKCFRCVHFRFFFLFQALNTVNNLQETKRDSDIGHTPTIALSYQRKWRQPSPFKNRFCDEAHNVLPRCLFCTLWAPILYSWNYLACQSRLTYTHNKAFT